MKKFDEIGIANGKKRDLGEWMLCGGLLAASVGFLITQYSQRFAKVEVVQKVLNKKIDELK